MSKEYTSTICCSPYQHHEVEWFTDRSSTCLTVQFCFSFTQEYLKYMYTTLNKILPSLCMRRCEKPASCYGTSQTCIFSTHWSSSSTLHQSVRLPLGDMLTTHTSHTRSHTLTHTFLAIGTSKTIHMRAQGSFLNLHLLVSVTAKQQQYVYVTKHPSKVTFKNNLQ